MWQAAGATDPQFLLTAKGAPRTVKNYRKHERLFSQGDPALDVLYILKGNVMVSVLSAHGKQAVFGILGHGQLLGEACLGGRDTRTTTATASTDCSALSIDRRSLDDALSREPRLVRALVEHLVARTIRLEDDLVHHFFDSSEKRLARTLLLLANSGNARVGGASFPKLSQETLAQMVGTTRSRVGFFLLKFKKLGFVEYKNGWRINAARLTQFLDSPANASMEPLGELLDGLIERAAPNRYMVSSGAG